MINGNILKIIKEARPLNSKTSFWKIWAEPSVENLF
jgi:hypothetical protein